MKKSLIAVALAFMSLSTAAQAKPIDELYLAHLDVFYGDLNLSNTVGARAMLGRIKFAATRVCGGAPDIIVDLRSRMLFKACVRTASDDAVSQLRAPLVTALYTGQPVSDAHFAQGR